MKIEQLQLKQEHREVKSQLKTSLDAKYDLELEKAIEKIKENNAKVICIQLPDGIKQHADEVKEVLEKETGATIAIWMGSCWGACDTPQDLKSLGVDLLIQWGHSPWKWKYWEDA